MKNHSNADRKISMSNIFDINRLGLDDSFESGNSITVGIDYKKENKQNRGDNFEFKLASVFREDIEDNIPVQSSLNQKNSNLFGSFDYNKSNFLNLNYNFALDNKIEVFKYNSVGLGLSLNNFITEFNFIKERSNTGNSNIFENSSSYNFNSSNSLAFKTRRNREINLTEYYDLVYEYKNDCLTAGIKFNKTYYEDRDLKPTQNLMFTISFYPLTSIDQSLN
jgi:LPS-assembly protein